MGGPIAPSIPESDLRDAAHLFGLVAPRKHQAGSALEWTRPSRRTAVVVVIVSVVVVAAAAVSALIAFSKQAVLCCPSGTQHTAYMA